MKEIYLLIQEKKALIRELYRLPKTPFIKQIIRTESRLLGELEHKLTIMLTVIVEPVSCAVLS